MMLRLKGISKRFDIGGGRETVALDDLSLELAPSEFVVMVGENGSGKSTLFKVVTGELRADAGAVRFGDVDTSRLPAHKRARYVTHIHQSRQSGLPLSLTVQDVMRLSEEARKPGRAQGGTPHADRLESIRQGLSRVLREQFWHLSGGEHQLVSLAVASIFAESQPKGEHILLLDEHVSQLDPVAHDVVMSATERLIRESGLSTIMATHNCELAVKFGERQIVLSRGRVVHDFIGQSRIQSAVALKECLAKVARQES